MRSQRSSSHPFERLKAASTPCPFTTPTTVASSGPPKIIVQAASGGTGSSASGSDVRSRQAFSGSGCVPPTGSHVRVASCDGPSLP
jgi:hypothetical protein